MDLWVNGIVAHRNRRPYVVLSKNESTVAQLTIAQARSVALDLLRAASYAETDAMVLKFFSKMDFPEAAAGALLVEFRDFRHELDSEAVETEVSSPDEADDATA